MPEMFEGCLPPSVMLPKPNIKISPTINSKSLENDTDVGLSNLEGDGALKLAERWAENGRLRKKLEKMPQFLKGPELGIVKRLLAGEKVQEGSQYSSDVEDIWEISAPVKKTVKPPQTSSSTLSKAASTSKAPTRTVSKPKPQFQKHKNPPKASHAETAAALARLRGPSRSKSYMDSDEETDCDEDGHAAAAEYFFTDLRDDQFNKSSSPFPSLSSPVQKENQASKSKPSPKKAPPAQSRSPPAAEILRTPKGLLTPRSRRSSQETPKKNPISLLTPLTQVPRKQLPSQDSVPRTPQRSRAVSLGSLIKLRSSASSSRHGSAKKQHSLPPLFVQAKARANRGPVSYMLSPEVESHPFTPIQNLGKRPATEVVSMEVSTPKRKKAEHASKAPSQNAPEQVSPAIDIVPNNNENENVQPATQPLTAASSQKDLSQEQRLARRESKYNLAEKLSKACPDLVGPNFKRILERNSTQKLSQSKTLQCTKTESVILPQVTTQSTPVFPIPNGIELKDLPMNLMPPGYEDEVKLDEEAVARKRAEYEAELAAGKRPGLVIDRMKCVESQEEE